MRDMMAQIRDVGDGIRGGTYTMTAPVITGGSVSGATGSFSTLAASGVATFSAGTVSAPAITTTGDTNTGIYFPAADTIAFTEGGVESMRINSSANVGIGTNSQSQRLEVSGGAAQFNGGNVDGTLGDAILFGNTSFPAAEKNRIRSSISATQASNLLSFETSTGTVGAYNTNQLTLTGTGLISINNNGAGNQGSIRINNQAFTGSTNTGPHIFGYQGANPSWWIGSFDNTTFGNNLILAAANAGSSVVIAPASGEVARATSTGYLRMAAGSGGIQFNGDTAAANALDDYEEGTWTPTLPNGGTIITAGGPASYTKIGRQVTISSYVSVSSVPNNGSTFQIGGLPFAAAAISVFAYGAGSISYSDAAVTSDLGGPLVTPAGTTIYFHFLNGSSGAFMTNAQVVTKGIAGLIFSLTYFV
jgi:hypothetical protein